MISGIYRHSRLLFSISLTPGALRLTFVRGGVLLIYYLLSGIALEKVHLCSCTWAIFEVDHVCWLLNVRNLWSNLIVPLPWIYWVLTVPHLVSFWLFQIASIAHLSKVILVLFQTCLWRAPLMSWILLRLVPLSTNCYHTLFFWVIIIVILNINLIIDIVHVLLL